MSKPLISALHILGWMLFLPLPYFLGLCTHVTDNVLTAMLIPQHLLVSVAFVILFYINYLFIIPRFFIRRQYLPVLLFLLAGFFKLALLQHVMPVEMLNPRMSPTIIGPPYITFMFIIVVICSYAMAMYRHMNLTRRELSEAGENFLKTQTNPHFLFNTLNSIYSLTITKSDAAPDAVVKLSKLLRYSNTHTDGQYVSLVKELEYMRNYISLQSLRLTDNVHLQVNIPEPQEDHRIVPFLLIPFIENAFEYGANTDESSLISISVLLENKTVLLNVSNNKVTVSEPLERSVLMSMNNTIRRLKLFYPGKYYLDIENKNDTYTVTLKIHLT